MYLVEAFSEYNWAIRLFITLGCHFVLFIITVIAIAIAVSTDDEETDDEYFWVGGCLAAIAVFGSATFPAGFLWFLAVQAANFVLTNHIIIKDAGIKSFLISASSVTVIPILIIACVEWSLTPSGTIGILVDKREKAQKLSSSLSENIKDLESKIVGTIQPKLKEIYESEKTELESLKAKADEFASQCKVLETRYECAKRIVQRNKELGEIINVEASKSLEQIEEEIKKFLKESKAMKLERESDE